MEILKKIFKRKLKKIKEANNKLLGKN